jgi:prophage maintenance system killer protein
VIYLSLYDYFELIFPNIREITYDDESKKPSYEDYQCGLSQLDCILDLIKNNNYYPSFFKKASYLFVAISTGHYFPNGNKRLVLFSLAYFFAVNDCKWREYTSEKFLTFFKKYFPNYNVSPENFNTTNGWALYNFNKAINFMNPSKKNKYNFNEIKKITEKFLKLIIDVKDKY